MDVTVAITTIPPRRELLKRAVASVMGQTRPADHLIVVSDRNGIGAWWTKNRALSMVQTEWVAFLDDDDEMLPDHLATLCAAQRSTGADLVWPYYEVIGGVDPYATTPRTDEVVYNQPRLPTPTLMRAPFARSVGGYPPPHVPERSHPSWVPGSLCDEWGLHRALLDAGAKFHHVETVTWRWHHHANNCGGRAFRERAYPDAG